MLNLQVARLMHKHGDEWVEMSLVAEHSPDPNDPERRLIHGDQVYRCDTCDDEIQIAPREGSG